MTVRSETIVIVGATGAFGRVMTARLAEAGWRILAVARSAEQLAALAEGRANVVPCVADIARDDAIATIRAALEGPVRMAVHGPGVPVVGGVKEVPTEAIAAAVNIKVGGFLRLARAVDEKLVLHSRLVAIGGHYGYEPTAYAATAGVANAALANLVRQLSLAYGPRGVTVHLISPGPADTERLRKVAEARAGSGKSLAAVLDEFRADSAIRALTTPEQVAWAVSLLLVPEADAMAGSALMLDSGRMRGLP
jgi:NAD(P)-dependent dehydrogenase (short-subunit alcohol dehydrogenase family)